MPGTAERMEFKTELKQLMDIIIHSLYTHREIFLRELISNACDAIDKARFQALTDPGILEGNPDWRIKIIPDKDAGTLTISDNGIGMSRTDIIENLGTIAKSGTRQFLENLKQADAKERPELIGQFGVGFYASFMVADKVTVLSRPAGDPSHGARWESDGLGEFTVESIEKPDRGTDVVLHLREDSKEFLDPFRIRQIVKHYSDFIEHPIVMDVEREEGEGDQKEKKIVEETLNSQKALWLRDKSEVSDEDYKEFYKHVSHDFSDPLRWIHYKAEGVLEFRALLYLPSKRPFDFFMPDRKTGLHLYIQRVFIMDDCEGLLPPWLRFVQGVVDSSDLPLNVSRETVQKNPILGKIQKNLTGKVLGLLAELKEKEFDAYVSFFKEFGPALKEGVHTDFAHRDKLAELLVFESSKTNPGEFTSFDQYLERMPDSQSEIYYLIGDNRAELENSPYLEVLRDKNQEVLFMTDPIDEWVVAGLQEYKEKPLKAVDKGEVAVDEELEARKKEKESDFKDLLSTIQQKLPEVKEVRLSSRLKDSAACLVAEEGAMGAHMERLMRQLNQGKELGEEMAAFKRILELNPDHSAVQGLQKIHAADANDPRVETYARLLYDQAVLAEGSKIKDPVAFAKQINELISRDAWR